MADKQRLSPLEIQEQLVDIDERLTKLEVRGRQLEDSIRKDDSDLDSTVELIDDTAQEDTEDETQMIEWFKSRQQELEDEQHEIDQRVRHLMSIPESEKTEEEKQEEEHLLQKLIDTVNQRSLIVDSQDEDRIR
ncbi:hypothetical protein KUTeg_003393 [Tegillarca granosa]|uniref:BMERB domain-containing protein n=1 Tax=Tegillarca granosa TaxID=220873 RepID=A0ABQ9FNV1_TEGGR|nr:hypothetical protein KUTeg_003393 [Tegillarca granosa]